MRVPSSLPLFVVLCTLTHFDSAKTSSAADTQPVDLPQRDYHIDTTLVSNGKPEVVIISSSTHPAYDLIAERVCERIRELSGIEVPILDAENTPTIEILARSNVIALGNLATSAFVETLYREWYTLLDLWYPGAGGYAVRSLHDPYGTGHNVILLGGSDDAGVAEAAEAFCRGLSKSNPLKVGRLAEIVLGKGHEIPPKGEWVDPRLRIFDTNVPLVPRYSLGYTAASRAGLIYFYNGDDREARRFRDLAINSDMVSGAYHYEGHMHAIIWDLIEESPVFSDEDRRRITAKLLAFARGADGTAGRAQLLNYSTDRMQDRHTLMQAVCTLTTSRYFGKYWPAEEWTENLKASRAFLGRQMTMGKGDKDGGGRGIYTYLECVLFPALLMRDNRLVASGALQRFAEFCLMHCDNTGQMPNSGESSHTSYPTQTLMKCAALLNDGSLLATMKMREEAEREGGFSDITFEFTAGQAWATGIEPQPAAKMLGVYRLPLIPFEHQLRGGSIPIEKSLDKLTMRSGWGRDDQYLLLDGLHGGPDEKPWPDVNSIVHFTQNGRIFLVSDIGGENLTNHNVVAVSKNGFGAPAGRAASIEAVADLPSFGYSHSRAEQHPFSVWDRRIYWRKGKWFVVLDQLRVREAGAYGFQCHWRTIGEPAIDGHRYTSTVGLNSPAGRDILHIVNAEQYPLRWSELSKGSLGPPDSRLWDTYCDRKSINRLRQFVNRTLQAGEEQVFTNLLYVGGDRTPAHFEITKTGPHVAAITGDEPAYVGFTAGGVFEQGPIQVEGAAFWISPQRVAVVAGKRAMINGREVEFSETCNFELDLHAGSLTVETPLPLTVRVASETLSLPAGVHQRPLTGSPSEPGNRLAEEIRRQVAALSPATAPTSREASLDTMNAAWTFDAGIETTALATGDLDGDSQAEILVGLVDGRLICLDDKGQARWTFTTAGPVRALACGRLKSGAVVLAGSDDEHVYAISPDGRQTLWKHRCEVPADRMRVAPWWTISGKAQLQAILPDDLDRDGISEILCGTGGGCVEALTESGTRKWLTPIEWGIPDRFAVVPMTDGSRTLLVNNSYSSCGSTTWRLAPNGRLLSADAMPTGRSSWDMTAAPGLKVTDLDGDNNPEAIIGRKGAYNEIALYDAVTGRRKWVHTMGDEITAVEVFDTDLDGIKEVIVGSASSWLNAFNSEGRPMWSTPMPHEVKAVAAAGNVLLAACNDANVYQVNRQGHVEARLPLRGSPLDCTVRADDLLIIGDSTGLVTAIPANR